MKCPKFTAQEQYLINYMRSADAAGRSRGYSLGYVVVACVVAGYGALNDSIPMVVIGFLVVVGFRVYEEWYQSRWSPVWRSIFNKYEAALANDTEEEMAPSE